MWVAEVVREGKWTQAARGIAGRANALHLVCLYFYITAIKELAICHCTVFFCAWKVNFSFFLFYTSVSLSLALSFNQSGNKGPKSTYKSQYTMYNDYSPRQCIHPFNGRFSGTTRVSRYQKGETNLDFTEARDSEWQWQQLGHMQVCISFQTDSHASTPSLKFFYRLDALPAAQPTVSKH